MAKVKAKWILLDVNSLEDDGSDNVRVKIVAAGGLERTASGVQIKASGVTDGMLAGSIAFSKLADANNIARLDQNETITALWNFPTGANAPTINSKEIATQEYVDSVASGLDPKDSCRALSSSNLAITGIPAAVDGVTLIAGDRILLTGQTTASQNGIWVIASGAWTRPIDFAAGLNAAGAFTFIEEGTSYAESGWTCTSDGGSDVIGTDTLAFVQFSGAGQITAGAGLGKTGNTLNVLPAQLIKGGDAEIDGDQLDIDFTPTNYTPSISPAEATDADHLAAHLAGIDDAIAAAGNSIVEQFTLAAGDITNKYVTLGNTPAVASGVTLSIRGSGGQDYGVDFVMDGIVTTRLTWTSLELDGQLASGDLLTVRYDA